jgi:hypothetical protein
MLLSIRKEKVIVSHDWHDSHREAEFPWGTYPVDSEHAMYSYDMDLNKVRDKFNNKLLKWYMVYEETMDYDTATLSIEMIEKGAHEELPVVEFNLPAKGYKPEKVPYTFSKGLAFTGAGLNIDLAVAETQLQTVQMEMDQWANPPEPPPPPETF